MDQAGLGTLHHDTYFARMAAGLGDKARILDHLLPGSVLDLGAGDGRFVARLRDAGWDAVGLDASASAVRRSGGLVRQGLIQDADALFAPGGFDNVVLPSVLHEVWSYSPGSTSRDAATGDAAGGSGDASGDSAARDGARDRAVATASGMLRPGGRLIVRDGVGPDDPDTECRVRFLTEGARAFFDEWLAMPPWGDGRASGIAWSDGMVVGDARWTTEFLLTNVWGADSLPREGLEFYTVAGTPADAAARLSRVSRRAVLHTETVTQPGYVEHWTPLVRYEQRRGGAWVDRPWPATNALWVLG